MNNSFNFKAVITKIKLFDQQYSMEKDFEIKIRPLIMIRSPQHHEELNLFYKCKEAMHPGKIIKVTIEVEGCHR